MPDTTAFHYRAFLSYSRHDTVWAKWLHSALENYRVDKDLVGRQTLLGPVPGTLRPIFLDRADFPAGHSLAEHTIAALKASHSLIVICSPAAVRSAYVNQEIRQFKSLGRPDRIIPIIIDGEPGAGENECFPSALRERGGLKGAPDDGDENPIAADARVGGDGKEVVKQKVVAGLLGIGLDEVVRRAEKARRRRLRVAVGLVAAIALAFAGLGAWAEINRREAVTQRLIADQRREEAERNFAVARQAAGNLVFDIAQGMRDAEGIQSKTVRKMLERAEEVINQLVKESGNDRRLLAHQAAMLMEFSEVYGTQGEFDSQLSSAESAVAVTERVSAGDPGDTGWLEYLSKAYVTLGDALKANGDPSAALEPYRRALEIRQKLVAIDPRKLSWRRDLSIPHERIAILLKVQGNLTEAAKSYQAALEIAEEMAKLDPENASWQRDLSLSYGNAAEILSATGSSAQAIELLRKKLALVERLVARESDNSLFKNILAESCSELGVELTSHGNQEEGLLHLRKALAIRLELGRSDPGNVPWQKNIYLSDMHIGEALAKQGRVSEALPLYRDALDIIKRIANPKNPFDQRGLAASYGKMGDLLSRMGSPHEALEYFNQELAVRTRILEADPSNTRSQRELSLAHSAVAMELHEVGSPGEALPHLRDLLALRDRIARAKPNNAQLEREFQNGVRLGNHLAGKLILAGDFTNALETSEITIAAAPTVIWLHSNRAHALMLVGRVDEARAIYLRYRGERANVGDTRLWENIILGDFSRLRKAGISHPLMEEIEKQFRS